MRKKKCPCARACAGARDYILIAKGNTKMSFSEIFYALEFAALILAAVSAVGLFVITLIGAIT